MAVLALILTFSRYQSSFAQATKSGAPTSSQVESKTQSQVDVFLEQFQEILERIQVFLKGTPLVQLSVEEKCHEGDARSCIFSARRARDQGDAVQTEIYFELACILGREDSCREWERLKLKREDQERQWAIDLKIEGARCHTKKNPEACRKLAIIFKKMGRLDEAVVAFDRACELGSAASCLFRSIELRASSPLESDEYKKKYNTILGHP